MEADSAGAPCAAAGAATSLTGAATSLTGATSTGGVTGAVGAACVARAVAGAATGAGSVAARGAGAARLILCAADRDALCFTGAGAALSASACDAAMAAFNRSSTEGVDCTTGWGGANCGVAVVTSAGAGEGAVVCAVGVSAETAGGTTTVCANRAGELKARTAAIAALAGRIERIFRVIAGDKPTDCAN